MKLRTLLIALALVVAACGDDDGGASSDVPDTPEGDATLTDTAGGDVDDHDADDSGPTPDTTVADAETDTIGDDVSPDAPAPDAEEDADDDVTDATGDEIEGSVLLSELDSPSFSVAGATARFTAPQEEAPADGTFGPCAVRMEDPANPPEPGYGWDAGTITVPGTNPPVTLTPVDEGDLGTGYESSLADDQEDMLPDGGLLTVSGAGGPDVGPFEALVQAPKPVDMSAPSTGLTASAGTDEDLSVAWNAAAGEEVLVTLSPLSGSFQPEAGFAMVCTLSEDSGTFTIPQGALELVRDGAGSRNTALGVTRIRKETADADGVPVTVRVTRSTGGLLQLTD
ncbi:MAG: hypothetical protein ACQEXJ_12480 [Myxococcota bacterium]